MQFQPIAELDRTGSWTDYIYANGQKIARTSSTYQQMHLNASSCGVNGEVDWNVVLDMGSWMWPDWADKPEAVPYSTLGGPQTLNLYGYVGNNPLNKNDSDGHDGDGVAAVLKVGASAEVIAPEATPIIAGVVGVAVL